MNPTPEATRTLLGFTHTCVAANHVSLPCPAASRALFLRPHPAPATRWVRLFGSPIWVCFVFPLGLCLGSALVGLLRAPFGFAVGLLCVCVLGSFWVYSGFTLGLLWVSSGSALGVRFGSALGLLRVCSESSLGSLFGFALWVCFKFALGLLWVCIGFALRLLCLYFGFALASLWVCCVG